MSNNNLIEKAKRYKEKYSEWREQRREGEITRLKKQKEMLIERREVEKIRTDIAKTKAQRPTSGFGARVAKGFGAMGRDMGRGMVFKAPPRTDMWGSVIKEPVAITKIKVTKRKKRRKKKRK